MQIPQVRSMEFQERRETTERFIERTGDGLAIRQLAQLKREREGWFDQLRRAATSHTTLKIALGVFLGVVAADLALSALRSGAITSLLDDIDACLSEVSMTDAPLPLQALDETPSIPNASAESIIQTDDPGDFAAIDSADFSDFAHDFGDSLLG